MPEREGPFWVEGGGGKRSVVPDGGNTGLAFCYEGKAQQRAALHDVRERPAELGGLGDFLKFADGFFQQAHFAEGGAQVVMRLEIFLFGAHFAEFSAKLVEDFLQRTRFDCAARRSRRFAGVFAGRRLFLAGRRRGRGRRKRTQTQLVDFFRQIGEKLVGSEAVIRGGGGILRHRLGLAPRGRSGGRAAWFRPHARPRLCPSRPLLSGPALLPRGRL